jgi:hypothetical protein
VTSDDIQKIQASAAATARQKSLELLFDYTKFHIGLYSSLASLYISATGIKFAAGNILKTNRVFFLIAVVCFLVAGVAAGIIASSITQTSARSTAEFLNERIGPWEVRRLRRPARQWTWVEHTAFWIGCVCAALSIICADTSTCESNLHVILRRIEQMV